MERMNNINKYGYSSLLTEISIKDKFQKETQIGKNKLQFDLFQQLCQLDPTTTPNKVGKYSNWILAKYNPNTDLNALRIALEWYADGIKNNIIKQLGISTDINTFKSYDELISTIDGVRRSDDAQLSNSEYNNRQKLEGQFEILGSTQSYDIVQPLTFKAERYFGSGTEWCTVANENYFNYYTKNGALFILYPKNGDKKMKMQFHFKSKSFASYEDRVYETPVECIEEVISDESVRNELLDLCKTIFPRHKDLFYNFEDYVELCIERLRNGENPENIFDGFYDCSEWIAPVLLRNKWNFINIENELLSNQWFDEIDDFNEGFARVYIHYKGWNFINREGEILSNQWFDDAYNFNEGFAGVKINGKGWNHINGEGEILSDQRFDMVNNFRDGFAVVGFGGKYAVVDTNGNQMTEFIFDAIKPFNNGLATVVVNGDMYYLNTNFELIDRNTLEPTIINPRPQSKYWTDGTRIRRRIRNNH